MNKMQADYWKNRVSVRREVLKKKNVYHHMKYKHLATFNLLNNEIELKQNTF